MTSTLDTLRVRLDRAVLADDDLAADRVDALIRHDPDVADLLPEVAAMDLGTGGGLHKDLADHVARVTVKVDSTLRLRLAALLHDVGKPATRQVRGREVTFHHHEHVGGRIAADVLGRLGYPSGLVEEVATIVSMSGRFKEADGWSDSAVRRFDHDAGPLVDDLLDFCAVDVTSRHPWKHDRQVAQVARLRARLDEVREADRRAAERPDLDGRQVMDLLGVGPGPVVGEAMAMLLDHKRRHGPVPHDEAVGLLVEWHARRTG